jgi:hypothetical protein
MSFSLFTNSNYDSDLVYSINGRYYSAINLSPYVLPEDSTLVKLLDLSDNLLLSISSRPLFVTLEGDKWIIYDDLLMILANSGRITNNEGVVNATIFKLPLVRGNEVTELEKRDFPTETYERFVYLINNGMSLSQLQNAVPQIGIPESEVARPESGLPGGSIGLSSVTSDGGRNFPVSIRRSALSEPGSPTYYDEGIDSPRAQTSSLNQMDHQQTTQEIMRRFNESLDASQIGETSVIPHNTPRVVLATATPMLNDPNQLQDMLNLLRPNRNTPQNVDTSVNNSTTLLTRQPLTGRLEGSGMRLGQMERDAVFTHSMNAFGQMMREGSPREDMIRPYSPSPIRNEYQEDSLLAQSYTQLMRQFYGLPAELPVSLIINGTPTQFIDFQTAANLLTSNQINRYILDPILQAWAGLPTGVNINRIVTLFGTNGLNYLVKAAYNAQNGQIYPPV